MQVGARGLTLARCLILETMHAHLAKVSIDDDHGGALLSCNTSIEVDAYQRTVEDQKDVQYSTHCATGFGQKGSSSTTADVSGSYDTLAATCAPFLYGTSRKGLAIPEVGGMVPSQDRRCRNEAPVVEFLEIAELVGWSSLWGAALDLGQKCFVWSVKITPY